MLTGSNIVLLERAREAGWDRRHRRVGVATLQPATVMRVDAAEFVPLAGSSSADGSWIQGSSHPATSSSQAPCLAEPTKLLSAKVRGS